jgi:hypothetical protein
MKSTLFPLISRLFVLISRLSALKSKSCYFDFSTFYETSLAFCGINNTLLGNSPRLAPRGKWKMDFAVTGLHLFLTRLLSNDEIRATLRVPHTPVCRVKGISAALILPIGKRAESPYDGSSRRARFPFYP